MMSYIQISNNAEDICQQADSLHLQSTNQDVYIIVPIDVVLHVCLATDHYFRSKILNQMPIDCLLISGPRL